MRACAIAAALLAGTACNAPASQPLPGAPLAPLFARPPSSACGTDISADENGPVLLRYRYVYDDLGRIAHAYGTFPGGGAPISVDYAWDNLDHVVQIVDARGTETPQITTTALYTTLGDLIEYTSGAQRYAYSAFDDDGRPTHEVVSDGQASMSYQLAYDATGRIARVTPETGDPTLYTYDDDARTLTVDTGNGAFHGLVVYDDANHELSESWDGTDPAARASEDAYAWDASRLLSYTHREATAAAPHELHTVEHDTYRYDCAPH